MRALHDYNFRCLDELESDLASHVGMLRMLYNYVSDRPWDDGAVSLFDELISYFEEDRFNCNLLLSRISKCSVPPEGEERYDVCFYPREELKETR